MERNKYYILGLTPNADIQLVKSAYKEAVVRFHPDVNPAPEAADEFLQIQSAYETLVDEKKKSKYDLTVGKSSFSAPVALNIQYSRSVLPVWDEPQLVYALLDLNCMIEPSQAQYTPISVVLVVDRSTSMKGGRMDMVKANITNFVQQLSPADVFSVITFSDRAEVIIPITRAGNVNLETSDIAMIDTAGGTEIYQGLSAAMHQLEDKIAVNTRKHIILLTDGQTYGDESECLDLAVKAAEKQISISAFGLGHEWNDRFLDQLSSMTGGNTVFVSSNQDLEQFLQEKLVSMGLFFTQSAEFDFSSDPGVELRYMFRLRPDSMQLMHEGKVLIGNIPFKENLTAIMEFLVPPSSKGTESIKLAQGFITLNSPYWDSTIRLFVQMQCPISSNPEAEYPPPIIVKAMSQLVLYRIQEKARHEVETGNITAAFKRLQYLASHLITQGKRDLARVVLREAENIQKGKSFSSDGDKKIKYGTRAFLLTEGDRGIQP